LGNGQYDYAPLQAETNGAEVSFLFVATGDVPVEKTIITTPLPIQTAAGASGGLLKVGSNTGRVILTGGLALTASDNGFGMLEVDATTGLDGVFIEGGSSGGSGIVVSVADSTRSCLWLSGSVTADTIKIGNPSNGGHGINILSNAAGGHGINAVGHAASTSTAAGHGINAQGGAADTTSGGLAGVGINGLGGAGAASTNGSGDGLRITHGGTTTVSAGYDFNATTTPLTLPSGGLANVTAWTVNLTGSLSGSVGSVTGAVGSVTGNLGGNVVGSVASVTAAVTLPSIPSNWITAAGIASGALTSAVWDGSISGHTTGGTFGGALNAAGSAGDPWATTLPGSYTSGQAGYIMGNYLTGNSFTRLGVPAGASVSADIASVKTSVGSVTGAVGSVTGAVGSIAGITFPTNFGILSIDNTTGYVQADVQTTASTLTFNLTGGITGNVTGNLSGSVGSVTGAVGSVAGSVGSVTGNVAGSVVGDVQGKVLGGGSSALSGSGVIAASVAGSVGSVTGSVGSVTGSVGSVAGNVSGDVAGKVLGGGGSSLVGNGVIAASVAGSVGSVVGAVGSVTGNVGGNLLGNVAGSVASVTSAVVLPANPPAGFLVTGSFGSAPAWYADPVAELFPAIVEPASGSAPAFTFQGVMKQMLGMAAGITTGMGTSTVAVKNPAGTKTRVGGTDDGQGNRSSLSWDNS
jgi:hypothetical protein